MQRASRDGSGSKCQESMTVTSVDVPQSEGQASITGGDTGKPTVTADDGWTPSPTDRTASKGRESKGQISALHPLDWAATARSALSGLHGRPDAGTARRRP